MNSITGEIIPTGMVDFENLIPDQDKNRVFNLTIRAYDLGTPPMFSDALIKVFVLDQNDNDPEFFEDYYRVSVPEDAKSGSQILTVFAQDLDGTAPHNEIVYRITNAGAKDKFVIEPDTGTIMVSRGASLDPDLTLPRATSYFIEVTGIFRIYFQ